MKAQVAIAGLLGIASGATFAGTVHGQKVPPAYFIAEATVKDIEADMRVIAKLPATAALAARISVGHASRSAGSGVNAIAARCD